MIEYILSFLYLLGKMIMVLAFIGLASFFIYLIGRLLGLGIAKSFKDIFNRKENKNARPGQEISGKNSK